MKIVTHNELEVYQRAFALAMRIFAITHAFPKVECYALTDQIRRSSRSVCANIAEAWRKRRYAAHIVSKLSDAEAEAAETQVWLVSRANAAISPRNAIWSSRRPTMASSAHSLA